MPSGPYGTRFTATLALALGVVVCAERVLAHHSIAGVYDASKPVTVKGVVRMFHFVNPHPWIELDVTDDVRRQTWRLELDNRFELVGIGMTDDTLKAGDALEVTGSASREGARALYVRWFVRPDGLKYEQVGQSPRLGGPRR